MAKIKTAVPLDKLRIAANKCDGHTIFDPSHFDLPLWFLKPVTRQHRSDGTPKGSIFKDGKRLKAVEGIYGLELLRHIAEFVKADTSRCDAMGRGTQARQLQEAINTALACDQAGVAR